MHDFHYQDPCGAPNPTQPYARVLKGTLNLWYCANGTLETSCWTRALSPWRKMHCARTSGEWACAATAG